MIETELINVLQKIADSADIYAFQSNTMLLKSLITLNYQVMTSFSPQTAVAIVRSKVYTGFFTNSQST